MPQPLAGAAYVRLIALGALIGIPAALAAAGFLALVHELQHALWEDLPEALGSDSPPWYLILGLPVVGAGIVVAARRLLPGDGGKRPIDGLSEEATPIAYAPGVALAALGTLPFGAVLGPEAPLIALGSVVGLAITALVRLGERERAVLTMAGSFSAIAALFGGPIVAGVLLVEAGVGMGAALIPVLVPGLVAAAIGYLIFVGLGDWGGLDQQSLTVPGLPAYDGTEVLDLAVAVAIGVAAALVIELVRRIARPVADDAPRRVGMPLLLVVGAFVVGGLALLADALGGDSQMVLFSGQAGVPEVLAEGSAGVVIVVLIAKALAYAVSLSCGFRGGPVFPAIFIGVALGTLAVIALDISPTVAVAAGAAAGMAAMTRLVFASLVLAALLVGTQGIDATPAAVLAAVSAWVTVTALERRAEPATAEQPG